MTPLALVAAVVALVAPPGGVIHPDGRVGQFRIDVTTKAQVVAALGKPRTTMPALTEPTGKRIGVRLGYSCGPSCDTVYSFSDKTGTLSDFATASRAFRTERGSRVGMSAAQAARLERKPLVPGCSSAKVLHVRWDNAVQFVVSTLRGRVSILAYLGPHSTYYEAFC
jgi:hypothetical protein